MRHPLFLTLTLLLPAALTMSADQAPEANYDEARVPRYKLPDPLVMQDGTRVATAADWRERRRPELLDLFADHVYGRVPSEASLPHPVRASLEAEEPAAFGAPGTLALGGTARRTQVRLTWGEGPGAVSMRLLLYVPANATGPVPVFLGLNFEGNHGVHADPGILLSTAWMPERTAGVVNHHATEASRGSEASRWAIERILARGYGVATAYYGDLDPDFDDGFRNGIHPLYYVEGQERPRENEWGAIGAWAAGLRRAMSYLQRDPQVDASRVALMGHSRLGKAALWAGAQDERFAIVISNESGCGGAALSRRAFGERVGRITRTFPHWFAAAFSRYNEREDALPVDQHQLLALIAPRPLYVASAAEDLWADPRGEFLSALHAEPVYRLLGRPGLGVTEMPPVDRPVGDTIGYHVRSGKHDVTPWDWDRYLDFADRHFRKGGQP